MPMSADSSYEMCTRREEVRRWMEFCPAGQKGSMSVGRYSHTAAMRIDRRGAEKPSQSFGLWCRGRGKRRTLWKRWVGHWIKTWGFGFDSAWCKCMFRLQGPSLRKATDLYNDRVSVREKKELRRTEALGALVYLNRRLTFECHQSIILFGTACINEKYRLYQIFWRVLWTGSRMNWMPKQ